MSWYSGTNPSALHSQEEFARALVKLMAQHPFEEISVTMLSQCAGLSRQTFYQVFGTRENVIRHISLQKCSKLEVSLLEHESLTVKQLAKETFAFFGRNRQLIQVLIANNLQHLMQEQSQRAIADLLAMYACESDVVFDGPNRAFMAGGIVSMLIQWAQSKERLDVDEQADRFARLFTFSKLTRIEGYEQSRRKLACRSRHAPSEG